MSTRYPGLPICQHIALGAQLQDIRDQFMAATADISRVYPKSSTAVRQVEAVLRQLDDLRNELDRVSSNESVHDDDWAPQVYYGQDREHRRPIVDAILERHRAEQPECCADDSTR